jgi:hypothetical protein
MYIDKVYNTNQTDASKKILMGMQIEDLPSSTFLYYYSLTSDLENINLIFSWVHLSG